MCRVYIVSVCPSQAGSITFSDSEKENESPKESPEERARRESQKGTAGKGGVFSSAILTAVRLPENTSNSQVKASASPPPPSGRCHTRQPGSQMSDDALPTAQNWFEPPELKRPSPDPPSPALLASNPKLYPKVLALLRALLAKMLWR